MAKMVKEKSHCKPQNDTREEQHTILKTAGKRI